ncbi:MAG: glycosyltransferase family 2 protein [candidate division WOR-3 bacterium]|nr:glycosyltransferase family 2 protein [candidate division WOR-3 bacterium]
MINNKLSIIIPVFNEKDYIKEVLEQVRSIDIDKEVIVVDDASTDGTSAILQGERGITLIEHQINKGKGGAVRTGIMTSKGDYVVIQDADLEYKPSNLKKMYEFAKKNNLPVVYGSRFLGEGKFLTRSLFANRFLTFLTNLLYRNRITDMETCYKMIREDIIKNIKIQANGFDLEPEITAKLLRQGFHIKEVPIEYRGRKYPEGKKIDWRDGIIAILTLIKWRIK